MPDSMETGTGAQAGMRLVVGDKVGLVAGGGIGSVGAIDVAPGALAFHSELDCVGVGAEMLAPEDAKQGDSCDLLPGELCGGQSVAAACGPESSGAAHGPSRANNKICSPESSGVAHGLHDGRGNKLSLKSQLSVSNTFKSCTT